MSPSKTKPIVSKQRPSGKCKRWKAVADCKVVFKVVLQAVIELRVAGKNLTNQHKKHVNKEALCHSLTSRFCV